MSFGCVYATLAGRFCVEPLLTVGSRSDATRGSVEPLTGAGGSKPAPPALAERALSF